MRHPACLFVALVVVALGACSLGGEEGDPSPGAPSAQVSTRLNGTLWAACGPSLTNAALCRVDLGTLELEEVLPSEARVSVIGGGEPLVVAAAPEGPDSLYELDVEDRELRLLAEGGQAPDVAPDGRILYTRGEVLEVLGGDRRESALRFHIPELLAGVTSPDDTAWFAVTTPEGAGGRGDLHVLDPASGTSRSVHLDGIAPEATGLVLTSATERRLVLRAFTLSSESTYLVRLDDLNGSSASVALVDQLDGWSVIDALSGGQLLVARRSGGCEDWACPDDATTEVGVIDLGTPEKGVHSVGEVASTLWSGRVL